MLPYDITKHLNTNARQGYGNLADPMKMALAKMLMNMPPQFRDQLLISDTGRGWDQQVAAARRHGLDPRVGKPGVLAPWGKGKHHGQSATAIDFYKPRPDALRWMRENAGQYGLAFPIKQDPWHMEFRGEMPAGPQGTFAAAGPSSTATPMVATGPEVFREPGSVPQMAAALQAPPVPTQAPQQRDPVIAQLLADWQYGKP